MSRTDDDSWDLASSVGATATMVAAARALATRDGLIDDPWAEPLVRAVGLEFFVKFLDGELDLADLPEASPARMQAMIEGMALRTRFFDEHFHTATQRGVRQAVILAAGLDSRAYRLDWPADTVVYEIDQPRVLEFKATTLDRLGARPSAQHRTVPIDLRGDWPPALRAAGFDPAAPTAWSAEGLLIYLPPAAQDALFDVITAGSAPASTLATEFVPGIADFDQERAATMSRAMRERGLDLDMSSLIYRGERNRVPDYLTGAGWGVTQTPRTELFSRAGLTPPQPDDDDALGEIVYIYAVRD